MNHGIVCSRSEAVAAYVWDVTCSRGEFVAIFTGRSRERYPRNRKLAADWSSAFVRSLCEPAVLDPRGFGQRPGFRHPTGEYARYEPEYEQRLLDLVKDCADDLAVVLPAGANDDEALRLLSEMHAALPAMKDRIYVRPRDKRKKNERRLRDVLLPIRLRTEWVVFTAILPYGSPVVVFLCHDPSRVQALMPLVTADDCFESLIEKW